MAPLAALLVSLAAATAPPERPAPLFAAAVVPRSLVERIEREYRAELKRPADDPIQLELLDVAVEVTSPAREVLADGDARWTFNPGGGTLDFAGVRGPGAGKFNVRIAASREKAEPFAIARVYFVPRGRPRELDGETFGDGCDKIIDMTHAFVKTFGPKGFDVFSTRERYLSTLAGTFLIAGFDQKGLQVGHVTFTDSRWPKLLCGL